MAGALTFRDVVTAVADFFSFLARLTRVRWWREALISRCAAAWSLLLTEAPVDWWQAHGTIMAVKGNRAGLDVCARGVCGPRARGFVAQP